MNLKKIKLGDYCSITSGGDKPKVFSDFYTEEYKIPVVSNGIDNDGIIGYTDKSCVKGDSITMAARGSCGYLIYRNYATFPVIRLLTIKPNNLNVIDTKYLYYALKLFPYKAVGSVQKQITIPQISQHTIFIDYNIDHQKKISKLLSALDNKIAVNNKINSELESMAKTIYNYWFLQFEFPNEEGKPYKSSGGKMVWNEELKREIPEGWEVKRLKDIVYLGNDRKYIGLNTNTIDLSVMPSNSICLNQLNESNNFDTNLFEMIKYDILFGSIRAYLKKAGIAPCDGAVAGTVYSFRCYNNDDYNFALETLCSENMFNYACKNSKGSKMPVIGSDRLLEFPFAFNEKIAKKLNEISIKEMITANVMENQKLSSIRDFLLPLLMNGQATFKE